MNFTHVFNGFRFGLRAMQGEVQLTNWLKCNVSFLLVATCCAMVSLPGFAQQSSLAQKPLSLGQLGPAFAPPDVPTQQSIDESERRARMKEERRMRWLKQSNGYVPEVAAPREMPPSAAAGEGPEVKPRPRMNGMSQEERYRLRSDIREAGFSAYAPDGGGRGKPDGR